MSDAPVRSLKPSGPLARQLLESGRADRPEPGARDRALVAFGFAPLGVLAVAPPTAAAAAAAPASALATGGKSTAWLMIGKSVAIGALGSVLTIGLVKGVVSGLATPARSQNAATSAPPASLVVPSSTPGAPSASTAATVASALTLPAQKPQRPSELPQTFVDAPAAPAPASVVEAAVDNSRLVELEALARVRRALSARESARALALLDEFARRFPASRVAEEAAVLRIETLRALGRSGEAQALGQKFLRERPSSVYGAKVSALTATP